MRGDGRIYQRGQLWWIAYYWRGKEIREPGGMDGRGARTKTEAKKKLKSRLQEIRGDRYIGPEAERLTVEDLLDSYEAHLRLNGAKSVRSVEKQLKTVREFFSFMRAVDLTSTSVRRYIESRLADDKAHATINRAVANLRAAFRLAVKENRLAKAPYFLTLRENNVRQGFFEKAEFELVAASLPEPIDDIARFAYFSGWRRSEILGLKWSDVDRAAGEVRLHDSKSGDPRTLPLEIGEMKELIERRWSAREYEKSDQTAGLAEYVFHRNGKPVSDFTRAWKSACETARVPGKLFHDLRRTAVRDMIRAGVPQTVAQRISGHRTASVFQRYDITSDEDKRAALRSLEAYRESISHRPNSKPVMIRMKGKD